jgi:superfamily II DNA or RNA helicase/HKD family nuclease
MVHKLIDIPNNQLDEIINNYIDESHEIVIIVSFIFEKGLGLILDKLRKFAHKHSLTVITSNYLKSTEPSALRKLLELKSLGAEIYLFDSLKSNQSFHIKSYYFANSSTNFSKCIIGSSNMSFSAFKKSYEFNVEIAEEGFVNNFKRSLSDILNHPSTLVLSAEIIEEYEHFYDENNNLILQSEKNIYEDTSKDVANDIEVIPYREPNIVQKDALEILNSVRELGIKKGLVVMATGLGKTILAALDASSFKPNRLLFVAHREEILKQSLNSFRMFMPDKSYGFYQGNTKEMESDFLFASIQTLGKKSQLEKFDKNHFDYIVVDEFHHVGARSYKNLVEYFEPTFFLGLTATPNRTDNIDILQFCGNNLLYKQDLIDGVKLNLLSSFEYRGIKDKYVDYTKITWRGKKFDEEDLTNNLNTRERAQYVFEKWTTHKQTRTLAFCASIKHCDFMTVFFSNQGIKAVSVHSKSPVKRDEALKRLSTNEIDILFSVDLFNEGVDLPVVDTIMMLRPTESKIIFIQQFGRGLRKAKGKKLVRVIDFIGNHKTFLEKPAALFDFELTANSMKKFIEKYNSQKLNLPTDCRVLYDPEVIDFFDEYSKKRQDFVSLYKEYKSGNEARPTATQFYQFIDRLSNVRLGYGSWFGFVDEMGDFSELESECLRKYKKFFIYLETTKVTKCFKIVVLDIFVNNNIDRISIKELCKKSFEYLRQTTNLWNETATEFKKDILNEDEWDKWYKYWIGNPIEALSKIKKQKKEPIFFTTENNLFYLNFEVEENLKSTFINLVKELIEYRFASYKISFDLSYVENGDINQPAETQIHKAFTKTDVPKLFKLTGPAAKPGKYQMFGYASPPGVPHQFIFVTLIKSTMPKEHRYHDYFKSDKHFHWQSRNTTTQTNTPGLDVINHKENKEDIHLFVRKMDNIEGRALPFTYCGKINFIDVNGTGPINVNFDLETPLSERLRQEFLRV